MTDQLDPNFVKGVCEFVATSLELQSQNQAIHKNYHQRLLLQANMITDLIGKLVALDKACKHLLEDHEYRIQKLEHQVKYGTAVTPAESANYS